MPLVLQIDSGFRKGHRVPLPPGATLRVGRRQQADFALPGETFLSGLHFSLAVQGDTCTLTDLNSTNGTIVRGAPVTSAILHAGDAFIAGQTHFLILDDAPVAATVDLPAEPPADPEPLLPAARERLLQEMRTGLQPLYAVLDAARDPRILAMLLQHQGQYAWLFEQGSPPELINFAPYLVPLQAASPVMEALVDAGWAGHWGIYLTSSAGAWDLLAFLRRLLLANQPDGQPALLRFYDPRVLGTLLENSTPRQWPFFFGTVQSYLLPGTAAQTAVGFQQGAAGLEKSLIFLDGSAPTERTTVETPATSPGSRQSSAPVDRLVLTATQMAKLKAQERDPLAETLLKQMAEKYPERTERLGRKGLAEWVRHGIDRPKRYGIRSDEDLGTYVSLMMQLGREFDVDLPWASDLLRLRLDPKEKVLRLVKAAAEQAQAVPPA